jgi:hypothetical protein
MMRKSYLLGITIFFLFSLVIYPVFSHGDEAEVEPTKDLGKELKNSATLYITLVAILSTVLVLISIYYKKKNEFVKTILFLGISIPVILVTLYSAGTTVYLNQISETKGPVHWHADFEIWKCGEKMNLKDPTGLSNRIGNPVLHEHNDDRMHVEGVVVNHKDVDLHSFFSTIGGWLTNDHLTIPTNEGLLEINNGDSCEGQPAMLQAFLYKTNNPDNTKNWIVEQNKLEDFERYILSPYSTIPPGDCLIIEFDVEKDETTHVCNSLIAASNRNELIIE